MVARMDASGTPHLPREDQQTIADSGSHEGIVRHRVHSVCTPISPAGVFLLAFMQQQLHLKAVTLLEPVRSSDRSGHGLANGQATQLYDSSNMRKRQLRKA